MNDWFNELQQQFQRAIHQASTDLEHQFNDTIDQVDHWVIETLDDIDTATSEFVTHVEPLIPPEVHRAFNDLEGWLEECDRALETSINALVDVLLEWSDEPTHPDERELSDRDSPNSHNSGHSPNSPSSPPVDPSDLENDPNWFVPLSHVRPTAKRYPACQGCQHYHGYRYGEHILVCAMHPYGWEDEECPDWEGDRV
ncbi:MAG: hypothetical protein EAZ61_14255 [Oscillatoriales cyanobacterium]|nr:MAG: hypothetical protein EAZ61_14255 [Oscillatoriales cyanobacterium]